MTASTVSSPSDGAAEDARDREIAARKRALCNFANSNPYLLISAAVAYLLNRDVYEFKVLLVKMPITSLRAMYNEFYETEQSLGFFEKRDTPPMVVAALLWYHLKTLAKPLFPFEAFDSLLRIVENRIPNVDYIHPNDTQAKLVMNSIRPAQLSQIVLQLPQQQRACLSCLFSYLNAIELANDTSPIEIANVSESYHGWIL